MTKKQYLIISMIAAIMGILFYAYHQGWIVIHYPTHTLTTTAHNPLESQTHKKKVSLFFWHNGAWKTETTTLLWQHDKATALYYLVNQWFTILDDEGMMDKKVTLQTAILSPSGQELYLSFDRNPLNQQQSTHDTLMFVEGLLKTIHENKCGIQSVRFLVHHQPLIDDHLDFTHAWPVIGFL